MPKKKTQTDVIRELKLQELEADEEALLAELELYLLEEQYEQAENNLYSFYKSAWERFDPSPFIDNWHLGLVCEHVQAALDRDIRRLLITISPRSSKSSICSVAAPSYQWIKHPEEKFITASYSEPLATQFAVQSRQLMNHPWYKSRWIGAGKAFTMRGDSNTKTRIDNDKYGYRIVTSPKGIGTGIGYSTLIIDDAMNARTANSRMEQENVINWYKGTLKNRANDSKSDVMILVGQRLVENDLPGYILAEESDLWFHLNVPLEYEKKYTFISPINYNDPRTFEGEIMDTNRFTDAFISSQKRDPFKFATLYQQRPAPAEGGLIKKDWLQYYSVQAANIPFTSYVMSFDLSMVDSESADYTVGTVWGRSGSNFYLIDMVREKMDIVKQLEAIRQLHLKYPACRTTLIEAKANGEAVMSMLRNQISGIIGIEPKDFGGNKEARLAACVPEFASHSVWFPAPNECPWINDVIQELVTFPKSKHDDIVDSISQAINWMALFQRQLSLPTAKPDLEHLQTKSIKEVFSTAQATYNYQGLRQSNGRSIRGIFE